MRELTIRLGQKKAIIAITAVSMTLSVVATVANLYAFGFLDSSYVTIASIYIAMLIPLIVAFPVAWFTVNMVLEIHKLEEEARLLLTYDALTGLLSRRSFLEQSNTHCELVNWEGVSAVRSLPSCCQIVLLNKLVILPSDSTKPLARR